MERGRHRPHNHATRAVMLNYGPLTSLRFGTIRKRHRGIRCLIATLNSSNPLKTKLFL
jgi:hypothetical protein